MTLQELKDIERELNSRPRKRLGFKTPSEVYKLMLKSKKGENLALGSGM
jgi:IS30 family transposase